MKFPDRHNAAYFFRIHKIFIENGFHIEWFQVSLVFFLLSLVDFFRVSFKTKNLKRNVAMQDLLLLILGVRINNVKLIPYHTGKKGKRGQSKKTIPYGEKGDSQKKHHYKTPRSGEKGDSQECC